MKYSSQKLGKILKQTEEELASLLNQEELAKEFCAAIGEDVESARPEYNFNQFQMKIDELNAKIRKIKHALNIFNTTTIVKEFNITVDQMLIFIPQLSARKKTLSIMKGKLPKARVSNHMLHSGLTSVDYCYLNYDLAEVTAQYNKISETLSEAQMALDRVNGLESIELEL